MSKGSVCVEAFCDVSHLVANFFGDPDRRCRSKESAFWEDLRVLVDDMTRWNAHILSTTSDRFVPEPMPKIKVGKNRKRAAAKPRSAVVDVMDAGAEVWSQGKFGKFIHKTAYDPVVGYPATTDERESHANHDTCLDSNSAFDVCDHNVLEASNYIDLHRDETADTGLSGALGGGGEYSTGEEEL